MIEKFFGSDTSHKTSTPPYPNYDENRKMHAIIWDGKEEVKYIESPRPLIADPRDVVLKITATTICGSDLHLYSGSMQGMEKGDILGHEFMGLVEDIGSEVKNLQIGDRVVVAFDIACGACSYCKNQQYTACDTTNPNPETEDMYGHRLPALYGYSHLTGGIPGGQAEYVRVPFADLNCLPIPDDIPDEKALFLSDVIPTAYHGTELANVKIGDVVGIWGLGPIGLMAARWCFIRGASRVIGMETVPERIEIAKSIGVEVIDFGESGNTLSKIRKLVPAGLDCSIECAGFEYPNSILHKVERALSMETDTSDILTECIMATKKCGIVSIIGVYSGFTNHFPIGALMEKGITVNGGQSPTQKYWRMALEKIQKGELDPTFIITHKASLSDAPELYKKFYKHEEGVIKVFLRPEHSNETKISHS